MVTVGRTYRSGKPRSDVVPPGEANHPKGLRTSSFLRHAFSRLSVMCAKVLVLYGQTRCKVLVLCSSFREKNELILCGG